MFLSLEGWPYKQPRAAISISQEMAAPASTALPWGGLPRNVSGKSAIRHILQHASDVNNWDAFSEMKKSWVGADLPTPEHSPRYAIVDATISLMQGAQSFSHEKSAGKWQDSQDVFARVAKTVQRCAELPDIEAIVVCVDKPSKVPVQKASTQAKRDTHFDAINRRRAKDTLEGMNVVRGHNADSHAAMVEDALRSYMTGRSSARQAFERFLPISAPYDDQRREATNVWLPGPVWGILASDRAAKPLLVQHFFGCTGLWQRTLDTVRNKTQGNATAPEATGVHVYVDFDNLDEGTEAYNDVGEADGSWAVWMPFLKTRHGEGTTLVVTIDTDVALIALLWQRLNSDTDMPLHICFSRPKSDTDLWMHTRECCSMVDAMWLGGVPSFTWACVYAGGSDFTEESAHSGVSIRRMVYAAQFVECKNAEDGLKLRQNIWEQKDGGPRPKRARGRDADDPALVLAAGHTKWTLGYWHGMIDQNSTSAVEEPSTV